HCARLACAGCHHDQRLAVVVPLESLRDTANAARLVIPLHDGWIDLACCQRPSGAAALNREFQLGLLVEALHCARRVVRVVPEPVLVAVGVEDEWALAELTF